MISYSEFEQKQHVIKILLDRHQLNALILQRVSSFAWATCGAASYINMAVTDGTASLIVTPGARYLVTTNIEAPRLEQEEKLKEQGWEFHPYPWHQSPEVIGKLTSGWKLGADGPFPGAVDLSAEMARLRASLMPEEGERFRNLGRLCAEAMDAAIRAIHPRQSEYEIAGRLAWEAESRGAQAIVNLIATDERIYKYRHPLPTSKKMERYALLVLCGRKWGLVCSITRLVHFGSLPTELRRKAEATAMIDATFIAETRPGTFLRDIFSRAVEAYAARNYPGEWQLHHQGGPAGYEPREFIATPASPDVVLVGQAYAWNPSITGTKSEDTILVGESGNEVLTIIPGWPVYAVEVGGKEYLRPAILEM